MQSNAAKEEAIRILDNEIHMYQAEISKNQDILTSFQQYKEFMLQLTPPEDKLSFEIDREHRYNTLKEEWCNRVKKDTWMDFLIFYDD